MSAPAVDVVDELIAAGLPCPSDRAVLTGDGAAALSLTMASGEDLDAWAEHVDTLGAVDDITRPEGWRCGPHRWRVVVGRLRGVAVTLLVDDDDPDTCDMPRGALTTAALAIPAEAVSST